MIRGRSTDILDNTVETFCQNSNDRKKDIIISALDNTLQSFQWYYQTAEAKKQYRNIRNRHSLHIKTTVNLLKMIGQHRLADDVENALYNDDKTSIITKAKVLSQAKKYMRAYCIVGGIKESTYNKDLAVPMELIFKEWCKKYPLSESPEHFDYDFDPYAS